MQSFEIWHHHAGVSVADLEAAIGWYERVMGFKLDRRFMMESIPAEIAVLRNGSIHFELFKTPVPQPASPDRRVPDDDVKTCGNKHVAFGCADVRAVAQLLRDRGADIVWVKEFSGGRANAFIRDCEGNLIEFVQFPKLDEPTLL